MRLAIAAFAVLLLAAGCGSGPSRPRLEHADAAALIDLAGRIAGESACAQARDIPKLKTRAIALVNARRVPTALQEPLISGVNALVAQQPVCLPSVPASATTPAVTTPVKPHGPKPRPPHGHGDHRPHHHGPGHGHGHGGDR
jgi:hypothetical protein